MKHILFLFFLLGCQDFNSNSSDRAKYGPIVLDDSDENYLSAYDIIQKRCVDCHNGYHNEWAGYTSNEDWINYDYTIIPGDPNRSIFMQKIINAGLNGSNMPQGGSALPDAEYQALKAWIENMK